MKVIDSPLELQQRDVYFRLNDLVDGLEIFLKLEGLNPAGSIKLKPAINMIDDLEERGIIQPGRNHIIESSSGNLGLALSLVCRERGYEYTCVTDPNASQYCIKYMQLYGAQVIKVMERDENGGYLHTRIRLIQRMVREDPRYVWTNQYANQANPESHARQTAAEIQQAFPHLDTLFVGAGTTGTLMGCAAHFSRGPRRPRIVAVDSVGSVTFGHAPARRYIPGLGTSRRPEIFASAGVDEVLMIPEVDTVRMAHRVLARHNLLIGGSSATVLSGVVALARRVEMIGPVVAISPDFGDKYIDTIFNAQWVAERFPEILTGEDGPLLNLKALPGWLPPSGAN